MRTDTGKLNASGSDTTEVVTNIYNSFGQNYEILYADGSASHNTYNSLGQLAVSVDADGVATAFGYNAKGEQTSVAVDPTNFNRVTYTINDVIFDSSHGTNVNRTRVFLSTASNLVSISETATTGLASWQTQYRDAVTPVTSESQTSYAATRTETSTAPDGSYTISVYSDGMLMSVTAKDSGGNQIAKTTYTYDAYGRQSAVTDARNGSTIYTYNNADTVVSVTSPNPGNVGGAPQTTTSYFNAMMQPTNVVQPDGTSVISSYFYTGELAQTSGSRTYPVGYSYDYAGRMKTMTNWSSFSTDSGARVTTWNYDSYRGWLNSKTDAAGQSVTYGHTPAARLSSRTWARGTNTAYAYNTAGGLYSVTYNDGVTAGVTNSYDNLGRVSSVVCGGMTTSFVYDWANDVLSESYSGGVLGGLMVTNRYDTCLRRTNMALMNGSSPVCQTLYTYDNASRLATVSDGTNKAAYTYVANSSLPGQLVFSQNGTTRMTTTKQYDYLNRLTSISSTPSNAFNYLYNAANQRTMSRLADSSYWRYNYDTLGQVISGIKYWADETPVAGQQYGYTFDTIGNRIQTASGGDQNGLNLRVANYTNNILNQITSRGVPGYVDIMGNGLATNPVTVNGATTYRKNEYFREQLSVTNGSSPVWDSVTVAALGQGSVTGHLFVPQNPETNVYDADGNLLADGRWAYNWDGQNRLVGMTSLTNALSGSQLQLSFAYDFQGRRVQKIVSTNNGTAYVGEYTNNYAYDRWNSLVTLKPSLGLINTFMWGADLSGSLRGAGGVGGLLRVAYFGSSTTNCFVAFDGNGNVSSLNNAGDGTIAASYEYGPFGELLRATGPMAKVNPFRFSTKYSDDETDFLFYGYRYYNPSAGRWLSRDPIAERGGPNIYGLLGNDAADRCDLLGLWYISRDPSQNWAEAYADQGDTVQSLAALIHLDVGDAAKWLQGWNGGDILTCQIYKIPNTVVVYTSKSGVTDIGYVSYCRHQAASWGLDYLEHNYHVVLQLGANSDQLFTDLWHTDGIFAYFFGGHGGIDDGVNYGFKASIGQTAIPPGGVNPPYKLFAIGAFCCESALGIEDVPTFGPNKTEYWKDLVSQQGLFAGYDSDVWWGNALWSFVLINPQPIPP